MAIQRVGPIIVAIAAVAACDAQERASRVEQLADTTPPPGVYADKRCWKGGAVNVFHNKSIDAKLLGVANIAGDAADAQAAFADAVELWKTKIAESAAIKDVLKLTYSGATDKYVGDAAGQAKMEDNERDEFAFRVVYNPDAKHKHRGDGQNTAATGHKHPDGKPARDGDGWIWNDDTAVASEIDIEKRLAETGILQDADKKITEGDITWFTHVSTSETKAKLIVWNYKKDTAPAPHFNYRPVMVHEIGHLLGLDHCTAGDNCEVMAPTIAAGDDPEIKDGEIKALEYLYGAGGPCGPAAPDGPPSDGPPDAPSDAPLGLDAPWGPDAGVPDAGWGADAPWGIDAGIPDAGWSTDAPWGIDAGIPDAGWSTDAPWSVDARMPDAGWGVDAPWGVDAGVPDAPWGIDAPWGADAGVPDAPWLDAPMLDAAWPTDAPIFDALWLDAIR